MSINFYGYLISASEEEFLCEGIGQMITEIDHTVRNLISFIDVLNFTDQEREIVDEYLFYLYHPKILHSSHLNILKKWIAHHKNY